MTATALTFDVAATPRVPFGRLVRVELRKMADTRAGRWLLISIVALTLLVLVIQMAVVLGNDLHPKYVDFLQGANTPMGILLPVLGVLSITSEWSQRTAMVTFTLEPSRMRVVLAKLVSLLIVSVVALVRGPGRSARWPTSSTARSPATRSCGVRVGKLVVTYFVLFVLALASGLRPRSPVPQLAGRHRRLLRLLVRAADPVRDRGRPDGLVRRPAAVGRLQLRPDARSATGPSTGTSGPTW